MRREGASYTEKLCPMCDKKNYKCIDNEKKLCETSMARHLRQVHQMKGINWSDYFSSHAWI